MNCHPAAALSCRSALLSEHDQLLARNHSIGVRLAELG